MPIFDCLGSDWFGWVMIILSAGVLINYVLIAVYPWRKAARVSVGHGRRAMIVMMWIFLLCGLCGYGTTILSGWFPAYAYGLKFMLLLILNFACILFLRWSRHQRIQLLDRHASLLDAAEHAIGTATMEQWDAVLSLTTEIRLMRKELERG